MPSPEYGNTVLCKLDAKSYFLAECHVLRKSENKITKMAKNILKNCNILNGNMKKIKQKKVCCNTK
jgi:hypothetical protein